MDQPQQPSGSRRSLIVTLQVAMTLALLGYLASRVDWQALRLALHRSPVWGLPAAVATLLAVLGMGTLRWQWLLRAYGAPRRPGLVRLYQLQLVGLSFNMLPGAVGGDVVRGIVTRDAFTRSSALAGLAVVFVERVLGLIGLLILVSGLLALRPITGVEIDPIVASLGLLAAAAAVGGIALGRRLGPLLPDPLERLASSLPALCNPGAFAVAILISVANQALVGIVGHILLAPLAPAVSVLDSLVLAPIAFAAIFFPLTVAGAGTRDLAMVVLYGALGVAEENVLGASLQITLAYLLVAGIGALVALLPPIRRELHGDGDSAGPGARP